MPGANLHRVVLDCTVCPARLSLPDYRGSFAELHRSSVALGNGMLSKQHPESSADPKFSATLFWAGQLSPGAQLPRASRSWNPAAYPVA